MFANSRIDASPKKNAPFITTKNTTQPKAKILACDTVNPVSVRPGRGTSRKRELTAPKCRQNSVQSVFDRAVIGEVEPNAEDETGKCGEQCGDSKNPGWLHGLTVSHSPCQTLDTAETGYPDRMSVLHRERKSSHVSVSSDQRTVSISIH